MRGKERATLTLTVSPGSSSSEELRISVPMEVMEGSCLKPGQEDSPSESLKASQVSGILTEIGLKWETKVRGLTSVSILKDAADLMDMPGVDYGLADAIIHVLKNECVRLLLEELTDEQEQLSQRN